MFASGRTFSQICFPVPKLVPRDKKGSFFSGEDSKIKKCVFKNAGQPQEDTCTNSRLSGARSSAWKPHHMAEILQHLASRHCGQGVCCRVGEGNSKSGFVDLVGNRGRSSGFCSIW